MVFALMLVLFIGWNSDVAAQSHLKEGVSLFYDAHYADADRILLPLAEKNDTRAAFFSAVMRVVPWSPLANDPKAEAKAEELFNRASRNGECGGIYWYLKKRLRNDLPYDVWFDSYGTLEKVFPDLPYDDLASIAFLDSFTFGVSRARRTDIDCMNLYPLLFDVQRTNPFPDLQESMHLMLDVPAGVERNVEKGLHLDGYAAHFYRNVSRAENYDNLYNAMREIEGRPPLPDVEYSEMMEDIWFGDPDFSERKLAIKNIKTLRHPTSRFFSNYLLDYCCPSDAEDALLDAFLDALERIGSDADHDFALCVHHEFDREYELGSLDCEKKYPPDWELIEMHAYTAILDGDFSAISDWEKAAPAGSRKISLNERSLLRKMLESSLETDIARGETLQWIEKSASNYFRDIADYCHMHYKADTDEKLLGCYRKSFSADKECISYTDYYATDGDGIREIRRSKFYTQCRGYLMDLEGNGNGR